MLYLDDYKQMREVNLSRISQAVVHPEAVNYVEEAVAAGPTSYKGRINLVSYSATEPETCFYVFSCEIKCSGAQLPTLRDRIAREELTKKFELYVEPRRGLLSIYFARSVKRRLAVFGARRESQSRP